MKDDGTHRDLARPILDIWRRRQVELRQAAALVSGDHICGLVIEDLERLVGALDDVVLNLTQASLRSGYSREHLGRLIRIGKIPNAGRPNAPKIRARDLPMKPGYAPLQRDDPDGQIPRTSKRQIVRSIASLPNGGSR